VFHVRGYVELAHLKMISVRSRVGLGLVLGFEVAVEVFLGV
jgi:hypothetical protein